jgi:hypothetical protein
VLSVVAVRERARARARDQRSEQNEPRRRLAQRQKSRSGDWAGSNQCSASGKPQRTSLTARLRRLKRLTPEGPDVPQASACPLRACPYVCPLAPAPHVPTPPSSAPTEIDTSPHDLGQDLTMSHRSHLSIHNAAERGRLVELGDDVGAPRNSPLNFPRRERLNRRNRHTSKQGD